MSRASISSTLRDLYLADRVVEPSVMATIRKTGLDFGNLLYVEQATLSGIAVSDDYFDRTGKSVWGDSVRNAVSPYKVFQMVSPASWGTSASNKLYYRHTQLGQSESWNFTQTTAPFTIKPYCKIAVHQDYPYTSEVYRVYYWSNSDSGIKRYKFTPSTNTWHTPVTGGYYPSAQRFNADPSSVSLNAILIDGEIVVVATYYVGPWLAVESLVDNNDTWPVYWRPTTKCYPLANPVTDFHNMDAQWGGVGLATTSNMRPWGGNAGVVLQALGPESSASILFHESWATSAPFEVLPSSQWGNMRAKVSGVNTIGDRAWATVTRWAVGMDDEPYARHVGLISSQNMVDWRDEGFVTSSELRGKLFYRSGDEYVYLIGNASVARAKANITIGADPSSERYTIPTITSFAANYSGPGSAPEFIASGLEDAAIEAFLVAGNELSVVIGASGETGLFCTADVVDAELTETSLGSAYNVTALGKTARATGSLSYRPLGTKMYESPYRLYSDFNMENRQPRLTVRQVTGDWVTHKSPESARYQLWCKQPGLALFPHNLGTPGFLFTTRFKPLVAAEGIYLAFWYKDEDNYYMAGASRIYSGPVRIVFRKVIDGVVSAPITWGTGPDFYTDEWYQMTVAADQGFIKVRILRESTDDEWVQVTDFADEDWVPPTWPDANYQFGLVVEDFEDYEGAIKYGDVDSATSGWIQDTGQTFPKTLGGKWLICGNQERQVATTNGGEILYVTPDFTSVPVPGTPYGVYKQFGTGKLAPQCLFDWIWFYENTTVWTAMDIARNALELAGITLDEDVQGDVSITPGVSNGVMVNTSIDMTWIGDQLTNSPNYLDVYFWLTNKNTTGPAHYSGFRLRLAELQADLYRITSTGDTSPSPEYVETHLGKQVYLRPPDQGNDNRDILIRVIGNKDFIAAYSTGSLMCAFPLEHVWPSGYLAVNGVSTTSCSHAEFSEVLDSFAWDSGEDLSMALGRLFEGKQVKLVENENGHLGISRFEGSQGYYSGDYTTNLTAIDEKMSLQDKASIIEMEVMEDRVYLLDREAAVGKPLRMLQISNPALVSGKVEAMEGARRALVLVSQQASEVSYKLHAPDPALLLEDWWTDADRSEDRAVAAFVWSMSTDEEGKPAIDCEVITRLRDFSVDSTTFNDASAKFDEKEFA